MAYGEFVRNGNKGQDPEPGSGWGTIIAIALTLAIFLGVGYYVYESLIVPPAPSAQENMSP